MHRRLRLTLLWIAAILVALVLAVGIAAYVLLQPQRFTDLLRAQVRQAGLTLALSAPAEPTLWPQPAMVLHGLTLSADNRPVLIAARARLVLPWRTLLGGPPAITRLELDKPRINLSQLGPVLAHMKHGKGGPPVLPHVDAGIRISHGSLAQGGALLLGDITLDTGPLEPGRPFNLQLTARTAQGHATRVTLRMTPHVKADAIHFDDIRLTASGPSGLGTVLNGHAVWRGGSNLAMTLEGTLTRSKDRHYAVTLTLSPANGASPFVAHIKLKGPGMAANLAMSPAQIIDWWRTISAASAEDKLPLPPVTGTLSIDTITLGHTTIKGLEATATPPAPASAPVPASSAPAPATSTHP